MHKKINILIVLVTTILLATYFTLRAQAIKSADHDADSFFAEFPVANQKFIKDRLHLINQDFADALAIIEKHKEAIVNFDYKNTAPGINLMLNEASVPVSWHLTIFFKKENTGWYVSNFDEYIADQN